MGGTRVVAPAWGGAIGGHRFKIGVIGVDLEDKLAGWTGPSSTTEQDKQDRTERMIREAIKEYAAFDSCSLKV